MKIDEIDIGLIKPYQQNPRIIPENAISAVAESIERFGFQQPIVCDRDFVVIVGHTRLLAAKSLGLSKVPVTIADFSEGKARAYRIIDNKVGEISSWDEDLLKLESQVFDEIEFKSLIEEMEADVLANPISSDIDFLSDLSGNEKVDNTQAKQMIGDVGNYVTMSFVMLPEDRDMVQTALKNVQAANGMENTTQALIKLMKEML